MQKEAYQAIVEEAPIIDSRATGDRFLQMILEWYGFGHVAYVGINIPRQKPPGFYFQNTYSEAWRRHYHSQHYILVDPVVRDGIFGQLPQDWSQLKQAHPEARCVFDEALDFGLCRQGLSVPVSGKHGDRAVFSVGANVPQPEWQRLTKVCMTDLQWLADHFHQGIMKQCGIDIGDDGRSLSAPERACLRWAAEGKSNWDTSRILGVSERTVKFHLSNARCKLHCVTTTQAVAKAINLGILVWP